ncbi:MAG: phage gp6-like head-tail connector protein [Alphaproteobacteria bacterium]|nr:phage gp6-like head-tail connector protein [Alphaproteobacteria bacterium]
MGYEIETQFQTVPDDLKAAVKMQAAHQFENREATIAGVPIQIVPNGVDDILRERRSYSYE